MKSKEFLGEDSEPCVAVVPLQRTWRQERRGPIQRPPPSPPKKGPAPESLYNRFTSKDQTSILSLVLN